MQCVLVVDIGTGGVHVSIMRDDGEVLAHQYRETRYRYDPTCNGLDFDPAACINGIKHLMKATVDASAVAASDILTIAVTSQRHGCVFLDADDTPLAGFPGSDARADSVVRDFDAEKERIYACAARMPNRFFPMLRLAWARKHRPDLGSRVASIMMLNEYLSFRLTGVAVSEWTNAAETLLFDPVSRRWSEELSAIFNAGALRMNRLVLPGSVAGVLTPAAAADLGLSTIPVILAASDTQSAIVGCGDLHCGDVVVVNGSTTPVLMLTDAWVKDDQCRVCSDICFENKWGVEANCSHSGLSYRKLFDHLLDVVRRIPGAEQVRREQLYTLFDADEFAPDGLIAHWGPRLCDFSTPSGPLMLTAENIEVNVFALLPWALIENLAFAITANICLLESISRRRAARIILTGGGSANRRLQHAVAALNKDSDVLLTATLETTSRGAAIQAWIALDRYSDSSSAIAAMGGSEWCAVLPKMADENVAKRYNQWLRIGRA